jgi:hypothetical protein
VLILLGGVPLEQRLLRRAFQHDPVARVISIDALERDRHEVAAEAE